MVSSVLRLSADVWTLITSLLDEGDVSMLFALGSPTLNAILRHSVVLLRFEGRMGAVNLTSVLLDPPRYPSLQTLIINPKDGKTRIMKPTGPLKFPPKLTSLTASFNKATDFFFAFCRIEEHIPNLTYLSLSGATRFKGEFVALGSSSKLSTLKISKGSLIVDTSDLEKLPPTLTELSLSTLWMPTIARYVWPPELSSLSLNSSHPLTIEHLPRTLTSLSIDSSATLQTSFRMDAETVSSQLIFPWRTFFPFLTSLTLITSSRMPLGLLLPSIVSPSAFDASIVAGFISSGFWDLPTLPHPSCASYPLFTDIIIPMDDDDEDELWALCPEFAPFLKNLKRFFTDWELPFSVCKHLPSLTKIRGGPSYEIGSSNGGDSLPLSLKSITTSSIDSQVIERLVNLKELLVSRISTQGASTEHFKWPTTLKRIYCPSLAELGLLRSLPSTLTALYTQIDSSHWDIIALQLVHLRKLSLLADLSKPRMTNAEPLTPLKSTVLKSFTLSIQRSSRSSATGSRFLHGFFGPNSPLPASLKSLVLIGESEPIPYEIFSHLPRQLQALSITFYNDWLSAKSEEEPNISALSNAELFAQLPPTLKKLELHYHNGPPTRGLNRQPLPHAEMCEILCALPRSLIYLELLYLLDAEDRDDGRVLELVQKLPPKLTFADFGDIKIESTYFAVRRPDLF